MAPPDPGRVRFIEPGEPTIEKATDLGSVQVLKHGNLFLLTDPFGDIHPDSRGLGLYLGDSRLISWSVLYVDGFRPVLLQGSAGGNYRGTIQLTNPSVEMNQDAKVHPLDEVVGRTMGMTRARVIGGGALHERLRIVNHAQRARTVEVELELGADGADIFEVRGFPRPARGTLLPVAVTESGVTFRYDGLDGRRRSTHVAFSGPAAEVGPAGVPPRGQGRTPGASVRFRWAMELGPGTATEIAWTIWSSECATEPQDARAGADGRDATDLFPDAPLVSDDEGASAYLAWERGTATVATDHELLNLVYRRSVDDLRLLVNEGPGPDQRYLAAGVPWFAALFGRDTIIAGLQALAFRPQLAIETLHVLASLQATELDDRRDAEPGKILHELRTGELAGSGELPHTPYYGSIDATPLWLVLLGATYDWTGDRGLVDRLWPNALAALDWIDRYGDRDGDGFLEYERRSEAGLINQGWKDSSDSIRHRSGREATTPIALAEVQGYVFDAKRRMADLARIRGEHELATRLDAEAETLRVRFEEAFWMDDAGFYALALDGEKRQVGTIGSNAGHALWSGIVSPGRARRVADRLLDPTMFSGWGIRTYAAGQPGYNPIGYHTGSVWPHDTSIIAAGLKRFGFDEESNQLVHRVFEAAQGFPDYRLPELFCGFDREHDTRPVAYPVACSPQAWAAGATFLFLETMLGLRAHADRAELELRHPNLPDWLGSVTVRNLRVGEASVDLLFHRWRGTTSAELLRKVGDIDVTIRL